MCDRENLKYIAHNNIKIEHLNRSQLHINRYGDSIIANNFLRILKVWRLSKILTNEIDTDILTNEIKKNNEAATGVTKSMEA